MVKTKQLIRQKIWFPGIDKRVEETIAKCIPCQTTHVEHSSEELHMSELPAAPWTELSADFKEIGRNKGYLLVVIDDFSRFPVVEPVTSTSAKAVIPKLDKIFSTSGIPQVLRTDNGPPFNSEEFANFAQYMGFTHRKIMPRWPQANGIAERLMRSLKKVYQTAHAEHKSSQQALNQFQPLPTLPLANLHRRCSCNMKLEHVYQKFRRNLTQVTAPCVSMTSARNKA